MARRKVHKILARDTAIFNEIVDELRKRSDFEEYDMETIEISVKKKIVPRIRNIEQAIDNLKRYIAINSAFIKTVEGEPVTSKKEIVRMLRISRPTLDKWILDGFITPIRSGVCPSKEVFPPEEILKQLQDQKENQTIKKK